VLPEATAVELSGIASDDAALARNPPIDVRLRLMCVKARFPGPESLKAVIAALPTQTNEYVFNIQPPVMCMLRAIADRIAEDPDTIRDALRHAAVSMNATARELALDAYRTIDRPLPAWAIEQIQKGDDYESVFAMRAALALGAMRRAPFLLERGLRSSNDSMRNAVRHYLTVDPDPAAARLAARTLLEDPKDRYLEAMAARREENLHDMSAALAEVALDRTQPRWNRERALRWLEQHNEPGAAALIEPLVRDPDPEVAAAARDAFTKLQGLVDRGLKPQLKPL
jgi:hypothetical protein